MEEDRIVTELFFEKSSFKEVSRYAKDIEKQGVKPLVMPPEDRGISAHLIIEGPDMPKVRKFLAQKGLSVIEKEVIIIKLENRPGTMAEAAKKISDKGINLLYAFSVTMSPSLSYVLLGTSDNQDALKALKSG
jgi:hypothetical protein